MDGGSAGCLGGRLHWSGTPPRQSNPMRRRKRELRLDDWVNQQHHHRQRRRQMATAWPTLSDARISPSLADLRELDW
jgi:hypothetical protein